MFKFLPIALSLVLAATVHAHFQMQFPAPRGVFVEDKEPTFCDGYTNPTGPRTHFPLSGGVFSWNSEHPEWVSAFFISTTNASSFNDFSQVNSFFQAAGEGIVCVGLDLKSSNVTGLASGQNVTVQVLFDGGDGALYQCADLTLDDSAPQGAQGPACVKNVTAVTTTTTATAPGGSATAPTSPPKNTGAGGRSVKELGVVVVSSGVLAALGLVLL